MPQECWDLLAKPNANLLYTFLQFPDIWIQNWICLCSGFVRAVERAVLALRVEYWLALSKETPGFVQKSPNDIVRLAQFVSRSKDGVNIP